MCKTTRWGGEKEVKVFKEIMGENSLKNITKQ